MRKTLFGQCEYSFFGREFSDFFQVARRLNWAEEYRGPHRLRDGTGEVIELERPPDPYLWLYDNGFKPRIHKAIDELCVTSVSLGVEGIPDLLRAPAQFLAQSMPIVICWKFGEETHVFGTVGCRELPEANYRFGRKAINPQLTPSDLEGCHSDCKKVEDILSQSMSEDHRDRFKADQSYANDMATSILILIALEDHQVIEVITQPLAVLGLRRDQTLKAYSERFGVFKW